MTLADSKIRAADAKAILASLLAALIAAFTLVPAVAQTAQERGAAKSGVHLESMQIEIWPEYDRPAALVILRAEIAADVGLPAAVSLRIPASSGGPAAVAYASAKNGGLLNLKYERADAADFITLRFTVPARFFHVEFYDRVGTSTTSRTYKYLWPGDMPVSWLDVVVQEPAGAGNITVLPALVEKVTGSDGLQYRSAQLGPVKQGAPLPIEIQYTKTDPRTSAEILKLSPAAPALQAESTPAQAKSSWFSPTLLGAAAVLLVAAGVTGGLLWWHRRSQQPVGPKAGSAFCARCGNGLAGGDRFCSKCGTARA